MESVRNIMYMTRRIRDSVEKLTDLTRSPVTEYVKGVHMIDLPRASGAHQVQDDVGEGPDKGGRGNR